MAKSEPRSKRSAASNTPAPLTIESEQHASAVQLELFGLLDTLEAEHTSTRAEIDAAVERLRTIATPKHERTEQILKALATYLVTHANYLPAADRAAGFASALDRRVTAQRGSFRTTVDTATKMLESLVTGSIAAVRQISDRLCEFACTVRSIYPDGQQFVRCTHAEFSWSENPPGLTTISTAKAAEEKIVEELLRRDTESRHKQLLGLLTGWLLEHGCSDSEVEKFASLVPELLTLYDQQTTLYGEMLTRTISLHKTAIKGMATKMPVRLDRDQLTGLGLKITRDKRGSWKSIDSPVTVAPAA